METLSSGDWVAAERRQAPRAAVTGGGKLPAGRGRHAGTADGIRDALRGLLCGAVRRTPEAEADLRPGCGIRPFRQ